MYVCVCVCVLSIFSTLTVPITFCLAPLEQDKEESIPYRNTQKERKRHMGHGDVEKHRERR